MHDKLIGNLHDLAGEFQCNEIAYLALTTKIEGPLRDRWAYSLHKALSPHDYVIAREWPGLKTQCLKRRHADLAILARQIPEDPVVRPALSPCAIIELKALYSFDVIEGEHGGVRQNTGKLLLKLREDAQRWSDCASRGARIYAVLLVTHPDGRIADCHGRAIKYTTEINKAVDKCGGADDVRTRARESLQDVFGDNTVAGEVHGGQAFGTGLSVLWWLGKVNDGSLYISPQLLG